MGAWVGIILGIIAFKTITIVLIVRACRRHRARQGKTKVIPSTGTVNFAYNELGYNEASTITRINFSPDLPKFFKS